MVNSFLDHQYGSVLEASSVAGQLFQILIREKLILDADLLANFDFRSSADQLW